MNSIVIKGFDPENLEELAELQVKIFNEAAANLPNFIPAKIEDVILRFKRETFDQTRMFYAYQNENMVGYGGLTGKNQEQNLRGVGFPWLLNDVDESVRANLYDAMENKCKNEGTKVLQAFSSNLFEKRISIFYVHFSHTLSSN